MRAPYLFKRVRQRIPEHTFIYQDEKLEGLVAELGYSNSKLLFLGNDFRSNGLGYVYAEKDSRGILAVCMDCQEKREYEIIEFSIEPYKFLGYYSTLDDDLDGDKKMSKQPESEGNMNGVFAALLNCVNSTLLLEPSKN